MEILRVRRGPDPDLIIRLPDGLHAAIAASSTDYAAAPGSDLWPSPPPLLDLNGLCQMVQLCDQLRQQGRFPAPHPGTQSGSLSEPRQDKIEQPGTAST